jgi:hypothetical protein
MEKVSPRMAIRRSYYVYRDRDWKLWILPEHWNPALWSLIQARIAEQRSAKHPQTIKFRFSVSQNENILFLKVFHRLSLTAALKELVRPSKPLRALRQGAALAEMGFNVPLALAAGEQRKYGCLRTSFLLTQGVSGEPLPVYLHNRFVSDSGTLSLRQKRRAIQELAGEIRRFHAFGFVHGDLVPSNVFVSTVPRNGERFYFMDNDRTGKYPAWVPQRRWRRNLVQLNRFPLPGITLQDRMRFLRQYLSKRKWERKDRQLIFWLENKTRQRRWVCDRVRGGKSFRELMRWNGPFAKEARSRS